MDQSAHVESHRPIVTVVVPTRDRAERLPRLERALRSQEGLRGEFEVIVVDDASTDQTWAQLERLTTLSPLRLRLLRLSQRAGPATARNAGWRAASAPVVAFTDDDCIPQSGWLAALLRAIAGADLVQGRTLPDPDQAAHTGPFSRTMEVTSENGYYQTCNIAYRKELLDRLGGFDGGFRFPAGEDTDLAWRAKELGARSAFEPDAVVLHDVRPSSFLTHVKDLRRWEGVVLSVRKHPHLRSQMYKGWFWKPTHPPAIVAAASLLVALAPGTRRRARVGAVVGMLPYARLRHRMLRGTCGTRRALLLLPLALGADVVEVLVFALASGRYRTVLL